MHPEHDWYVSVCIDAGVFDSGDISFISCGVTDDVFVRYSATISAIVLALTAFGCDRLSGTAEGGEQARWAEYLEAHGPPPRAGEGEVLDESRAVAVLTPDETEIGGETLGTNPTVMEVAQVLERTEGGDTGWVVWVDREVTVRQLAGFVQKLEVAGQGPTVYLAVDVSASEVDPEIRGVRLAPAGNDELSASNAWAVHAPESTKVTDFLGQLRERRQDRGEKLEDFSE